MKGWTRVRFDEVCEIAGALVDPREPAYADLPHVGGANIESETGRLLALQTAREEGLKSGKFIFDARDVLYSKIRPYLKKVARPEFSGLCSADIYPLRPVIGRLDRDFLFYLLLSADFTDYAIAGSARAGMPKVNRDHLFAFTCSLPPMSEQRRLVRILDEALASLGTLLEGASKSHRETAEILAAHSDGVLTQVRADWKRVPLGELVEFRNGLNFTKGSRGSRVKIVGVRNFQNHFSAPMDDLDTVTIDGKLADADALAKDDILAVRSNGNIDLIGRCMLVEEVQEPTAHSGFTIRVRLHEKCLLPRFLCYVLRARNSRKKLTEGGSGANIKSLSQGTLADLIVPLPSLQEQRRIVATLDALTEETQDLACIYERKGAALGALKESLLYQAFSGQL